MEDPTKESSPGKQIDLPVTEAFEVSDFFNVNSNDIRFSSVDSDLKKMWGTVGVEGPRRLGARALGQKETFFLDGEGDSSLADIKFLLEQQPNGEEGFLLTTEPNFFMVAGCVVRLWWGGMGWRLSLDKNPSTGFGRWWDEGDQLISRA
ncbi:MAG: hypothetical protein WCV68_01365 [Candidatus Paceibacterota bacterium]|jgi:hypothetical protein